MCEKRMCTVTVCVREISGTSGGASVGAARSRGQVVGMIGTRDTRGRGERDEEHGKEGGDELEVEASVRQNFQTKGQNRDGVWSSGLGVGNFGGSGWGGGGINVAQRGQALREPGFGVNRVSALRGGGGRYRNGYNGVGTQGGMGAYGYPGSGFSGMGQGVSSPGSQDRVFTSFLGPRSVLNINKGTGPIGNGFVHPLAGQALSSYQIRPGVLSPRDQGSLLDLINTSYEPFVLILAAGGAVLSFLLYQVILTKGRRRGFRRGGRDHLTNMAQEVFKGL